MLNIEWNTTMQLRDVMAYLELINTKRKFNCTTVICDFGHHTCIVNITKTKLATETFVDDLENENCPYNNVVEFEQT